MTKFGSNGARIVHSEESSAAMNEACRCLSSFADACNFTSSALPSQEDDYESEFGRMIYTISILLMFSFVIVLLMIRSIKSSSSRVEMDTLLDAMRFREELDIRERQRRRLMKAKTKVTAWLTRTQGEKVWKSQQATMPRKQTSISTMSDIPEIVVTEDISNFPRSRTPALSLIYDFAEGSEASRANSRMNDGRGSICSSNNGTLSRNSFSIDLEVPQISYDQRSYSQSIDS
ncbi:unnamed protein product [Caenorhabditis auriculariae]|uniref:Uncharacterized protein n=1 Tax=Caenorhabditis auriculariae TaxID=2777116 RepID=A0A8S1HM42_9PELO|nr:unnamed protein product [Caenorhabditis auriculariae]